MITLVTPATDYSLLNQAELRLAVGATDASQDVLLASLGARAASLIASYCNVRRIGVARPTFKEERVEEIQRISHSVSAVIFARRFVKQIHSVTFEGDLLAPTAYEMDDVAGLLYRLESDERCYWRCGKLVMNYTAGFSTIPDEIKFAAAKLVNSMSLERLRDPNLKREKVEGIGEQEFWVGSKDDPALPSEVVDALAPFMEYRV